jgi:hypothetical protein
MEQLVHVFGVKQATDAPPLTDRFCRPGASFDGRRERHGIKRVYHEETTRLVCGKLVCSTCRMVEV